EVRRVPQTDALAEQKAHSRRGIDALIEHIAYEGVLPAADTYKHDVAITTGETEGKGFYAAIKSIVQDLKFTSSIVIATTLNKDWGCKPWKSGHRRGIEFPPLPELRELFDRKHGPQDWPPIDAWGGGKP